MNIKTFLLSSTLALSAVSGSQAASTVPAKPEPIEYVRACDAYGPGYFYIPGTETCIRVSGNVRADFTGGDNVNAITDADLANGKKTYRTNSRLTLIFQAASETELGTLRSYAEIRSQWSKGKDSSGGQLRAAYIEIGGFRVGLDSTIFDSWTGGYGKVINGDSIAPAGDIRTNTISYTFNADSGFSAIVGVELGNASGPALKTNAGNSIEYYYIDKDSKIVRVDETDLPSKQTKDYNPNILFGMKFMQKWGGASTVVAYDAYYKKWAAKARVDLNINDNLNLWAMGGYKNNLDYYRVDTVEDSNNVLSRQNTTIYANWGGKWAAWAGATYKINPKANLNAQVSYSAIKTFATSVNVAYKLIPGFVITPELTYISWNDDRTFKGKANSDTNYSNALNGKSALQSMIRFQRSF
ncbi:MULTISPECIES: porin [unclassified Bartonella]|uniref:porin n=1 Tax=unclassified Bartonella TaxID=2645622 RepID=UPI00099A6981|nr:MULTISPECIES: porin [unclassified Bartonella]AQX23182.1 Porin subfamily protein [Bartonella sp. 11B]AQX23518.1 Porin subfamily protein [Bartonella sp. 114]AQX25638.1 Porin subfamily protein [Bartonella sp. Coyote22sub2]